MTRRFKDRARAVRDRGIPPIEGPERRRFIEQAQLDYMDYAMIGDAEATLEEGVLTLRIDLAPAEASTEERADPPEPGEPDPGADQPP